MELTSLYLLGRHCAADIAVYFLIDLSFLSIEFFSFYIFCFIVLCKLCVANIFSHFVADLLSHSTVFFVEILNFNVSQMSNIFMINVLRALLETYLLTQYHVNILLYSPLETLYFFMFVVLGIDPRVLHMLGKYSTTKPYSQLCISHFYDILCKYQKFSRSYVQNYFHLKDLQT